MDGESQVEIMGPHVWMVGPHVWIVVPHVLMVGHRFSGATCFDDCATGVDGWPQV